MLPNMVLCRIPDCGTDGLFRSCENSSPEPRGPKRLRMETSSLQAKVYNTEIKSQSSIYDAWREYGKCIISSELCLHLPIVYAFYMSTRYSARGRRVDSGGSFLAVTFARVTLLWVIFLTAF